MSNCGADPGKGKVQIFVDTVDTVMSTVSMMAMELQVVGTMWVKRRGRISTVTVAAGYVKSLTVLLIPVLWL